MAKALAVFEHLEGSPLATRLRACLEAAAEAVAEDTGEEWNIDLNLAGVQSRVIALAGTGEGLLAVADDAGRVGIRRRRTRAAGKWAGLTNEAGIETWQIDHTVITFEQRDWTLFAGDGCAAAATEAQLTLAAWDGRGNAAATAEALIEELKQSDTKLEASTTVVTGRMRPAERPTGGDNASRRGTPPARTPRVASNRR